MLIKSLLEFGFDDECFCLSVTVFSLDYTSYNGDELHKIVRCLKFNIIAVQNTLDIIKTVAFNVSGTVFGDF